MVNLVFAAFGQRLVYRRGSSPVIAGNGTVCRFDLSDGYGGCDVYAEFAAGSARCAVRLDGSRCCALPPEVAVSGRFSVRLVARRGASILRTNYEHVTQEVR